MKRTMMTAAAAMGLTMAMTGCIQVTIADPAAGTAERTAETVVSQTNPAETQTAKENYIAITTETSSGAGESVVTLLRDNGGYAGPGVKDNSYQLIKPAENYITVDTISDVDTYAAIKWDDIYWSQERMVWEVDVYQESLYDIVDIAMMSVGDHVVIDGKEVKVTSRVDTRNGVEINGGGYNGGYTFYSKDDTNGFFAMQYEIPVLQNCGRYNLPVDVACFITDNANLENLRYTPEQFYKMMQQEGRVIQAHQMKIKTRDAYIVDIDVLYTP